MRNNRHPHFCFETRLYQVIGAINQPGLSNDRAGFLVDYTNLPNLYNFAMGLILMTAASSYIWMCLWNDQARKSLSGSRGSWMDAWIVMCGYRYLVSAGTRPNQKLFEYGMLNVARASNAFSLSKGQMDHGKLTRESLSTVI